MFLYQELSTFQSLLMSKKHVSDCNRKRQYDYKHDAFFIRPMNSQVLRDI